MSYPSRLKNRQNIVHKDYVLCMGPVPCNVSQMHFNAVNWLCENIHLKKIVCLIHACHPQLALSNVEPNGMSIGFSNVLDIWWITLHRWL